MDNFIYTLFQENVLENGCNFVAVSIIVLELTPVTSVEIYLCLSQANNYHVVIGHGNLNVWRSVYNKLIDIRGRFHKDIYMDITVLGWVQRDRWHTGSMSNRRRSEGLCYLSTHIMYKRSKVVLLPRVQTPVKINTADYKDLVKWYSQYAWLTEFCGLIRLILPMFFKVASPQPYCCLSASEANRRT